MLQCFTEAHLHLSWGLHFTETVQKKNSIISLPAATSLILKVHFELALADPAPSSLILVFGLNLLH